MAVTMDMLKVVTMKTPGGKIPDGMKVTALSGPNAGPIPASPALAIGGFTLWPMSYMDNRVSFGMVMYGVKNQPLNYVEKQGARYVYKITLQGEGANGTVTFWGQSDQSVTMSLNDLGSLMLEK